MTDYREIRTLQNQEIVSASRYINPIEAVMTISRDTANLGTSMLSTPYSPVQDLYLVGIKTIYQGGSSTGTFYNLFQLKKTSSASPTPATIMTDVRVERSGGDRITTYDLGNKLHDGSGVYPERIVSPLDSIWFFYQDGATGSGQMTGAAFICYFVPYRSNIT